MRRVVAEPGAKHLFLRPKKAIENGEDFRSARIFGEFGMESIITFSRKSQPKLGVFVKSDDLVSHFARIIRNKNIFLVPQSHSLYTYRTGNDWNAVT